MGAGIVHEPFSAKGTLARAADPDEALAGMLLEHARVDRRRLPQLHEIAVLPRQPILRQGIQA
ncbi:Uncharacterised protein [Mycobacterium tuberculosis]|nr:Uncharacterised protein [Mycobacterium tuberculosis]